jgi:hypothetical protein
VESEEKHDRLTDSERLSWLLMPRLTRGWFHIIFSA